MTPKGWVYLIGSVILLIAIWLWGGLVWSWYQDSKTLESVGRDVQATATMTDEVQDTLTESRERSQGVTQRRQQTETQYHELAQTVPTVAQFDATPVPDELRQLAREKREQRERLAGDEHRGGGTKPAD